MISWEFLYYATQYTSWKDLIPAGLTFLFIFMILFFVFIIYLLGDRIFDIEGYD